jgi:hypothetical protein
VLLITELRSRLAIRSDYLHGRRSRLFWLPISSL